MGGTGIEPSNQSRQQELTGRAARQLDTHLFESARSRDSYHGLPGGDREAPKGVYGSGFTVKLTRCPAGGPIDRRHPAL